MGAISTDYPMHACAFVVVATISAGAMWCILRSQVFPSHLHFVKMLLTCCAQTVDTSPWPDLHSLTSQVCWSPCQSLEVSRTNLLAMRKQWQCSTWDSMGAASTDARATGHAQLSLHENTAHSDTHTSTTADKEVIWGSWVRAAAPLSSEAALRPRRGLDERRHAPVAYPCAFANMRGGPVPARLTYLTSQEGPATTAEEQLCCLRASPAGVYRPTGARLPLVISCC